MVEPFVAVIRNTLFPVRFVLQGTPSSLVPTTKGMHHQHQPLFFSSNFFGPVPRRTKGKEREREELRLGRVLQCKEWSCRSTKHAFCCPARGLSFMLQELVSPREQSTRRFQNPRTHPTNRLGKHRAVRLRTSLGTQRRHVSLAAHPAEASEASEASTSALPKLRRKKAIRHMRNMLKLPLEEFDLDVAWRAFDVSTTREGGAVFDVDIMLRFSQMFCAKIESLYDDDRKYAQLRQWADRFQILVGRLQELFQIPLTDDQRFRTLHLLIARSRALHGQEEAAIEILQRIRTTWREVYYDTDIAATYDSICASGFYYNDATHVINFLDRHFIYEYFRPPYCFFYRDPAIETSIQCRHPRLLSILSTIRDPTSLFQLDTDQQSQRSRDWRSIGTVLILAYCEHKLPQLALRTYEVMERSRYMLDDLLKLRLVRALAKGGFYDDAQRIYNEVPSDALEYTQTGMHLFALQGDTTKVFRSFNSKKRRQKHHHSRLMLLFSLAVQGKTNAVRKLFNELYPQDDSGHYTDERPDVTDYAVLIFAYARRSDPHGIERFLKRMEEEGIEPNLHIYSSLIQSNLQCGDLDAVAEVLDQMRDTGVQPNAVVYTNVITALGRHHGPSSAEGAFKRALREDVTPDPAMVGSLMSCYVEAGAWDEVVSLFKSLESDTKSPLQLTIELYNMTLKAYVLMGAPFRVVATLFEKLDRDPSVYPTHITFALLLQSACDSGHMRAAMDIFREMDGRAKRGARSLINAYVFTILMSGFLRQGKKDQALAVYEQMLNRGIEPTSATFNTVLSYYANDKSAELLRVAYEFITRVAKRDEDTSVIDESNMRLSPLQAVYEPLLRGYASAGNVEGFEKLLDEMLEAGGQLTISALSSLLNLYRTKGRVDSAAKVWDHLLELGQESLRAAALMTEEESKSQAQMQKLCVPLSIYLDTLSQVGEHEKVLEVWRGYQEMGFSFNLFNWNRLGTYLIRGGEYERAFEVLDQVILPYIRLTLNQQTPQDERDAEEKEESQPKRRVEDDFKSPFDILNKTKLSFLQNVVGHKRPRPSVARSVVIRHRSSMDPDDGTSSLALEGLNPPPSDSQPAYDFLSTSSIPEFVRPLNFLAHSPGGDIPKPHHTLLHHLLIGYQRLRSGQPAIPSVDPGSVDDFYYAEYTLEQETKVRDQLEYIHTRFPDAVRAVMEFQMAERERLGDEYERLYIWG